MVVYNFKSITVVPTAKDFLDIVLSRTQRKTPTEIHKSYPISRIRAFYMRKVRYTQQNYHDKLNQMLTEFPLLDDIHPFYAELINILYDRDHYKLALGQINTAKHLIDNLAKDHVRLLKYGDSLYRCKQLKRAGMGRMCTLVRKLAPSLAYLEQVRQHLARLPCIDPTTRTLILCGYPNVGKSSFMNKVTRANVDVQPYAFTTKSLYVGHTDYKYITWQVIDTPGILDHPLDERNTIEMQSITAMAHLQAAILFVLDISEQCGYTIKQQVSLFHSIKPLFVGKPIIVAINKIDVTRPEQVDPEDKALIEALADVGKGGMGGVKIVPMSTLTEEGVTSVLHDACDALLEARVDKKIKSNRIASTVNRLHVAMPVRRDDKSRPAVAAPVVDKEMEEAAPVEERQRGFKDETTFARMQRLFEERIKKEQEEAEMWSRGEVPGMNSTTWQQRYMLKNPEWNLDKIPEILDGKNISDFVDEDINELLEELEREDEERVAKLAEEEANKSSESELDEEEVRILTAIRRKKALMQKEHGTDKARGRVAPREITHRNQTFDELKAHLRGRGFDDEQANDTVANIRTSRSRSRAGRKRERTASRGPAEEEGMTVLEKKKARRESRSKSRLLSLTPKPGSGMKDLQEALRAQDIANASRKERNRDGRRGESDRHIASKMPKHLFSGKRGIGKTDRR